MLTTMNGDSIKVVISDAAKQLCITEESILTLIKYHRICTDKVGQELHVRDEDIHYFCQYLSEYGKLPDLPREALHQRDPLLDIISLADENLMN